MFTNQHGAPLSSKKPPASAERDGIGQTDVAANRLITRRCLVYFLHSVIFSCGRLKGLSHLDFLIALAIWNANSRQQVADVRAADGFCFGGDDPAVKRSGISRSSVSRLLNIPLETVRRRVGILMRGGIVAEHRDGLVCIGSRNAYDGDFSAIERNNADALAAMYNRIVDDGIVLPPAPWIAASDGKRQDRARGEWLSALTLYSTEYQVLMLSEMLSVFRVRFVDILILLTVLMRNVEHLMGGSASRSIPYILPDALRRGVARKAVERYLDLPNETVRRHIFSLLSKGLLVEREDGVVLPGAVIAQYVDGSSLAAHNTRYMMAMFSRLQLLAEYRAVRA